MLSEAGTVPDLESGTPRSLDLGVFSSYVRGYITLHIQSFHLDRRHDARRPLSRPAEATTPPGSRCINAG